MISAEFLETTRLQALTCLKRLAGNHRADDRCFDLRSQVMGIGDRLPVKFPFQPQAGVAERLHRDHPRLVNTRLGSNWLRIDDVQLKSLRRAGESMAAAKPLHPRVLAAHERAHLPRPLAPGISDAGRQQSTPDAASLSLRGDRQQIQFNAAPARRMSCEEAADKANDRSVDSSDQCLALSQNTANSARASVNGGDARIRCDAPNRAGVFRIGDADLYAH